MISSSTPADRAWSEYLRSIDEARTIALDWRWSKTPAMRCQAMYFISMMQAFGFNTYMGPRAAYPTFFSHLMFTPVEYNWGAPSPDFRYHWTKIDGARRYRIWGRRGQTPWLRKFEPICPQIRRRYHPKNGSSNCCSAAFR
jgi:hypothetical protein